MTWKTKINLVIYLNFLGGFLEKDKLTLKLSIFSHISQLIVTFGIYESDNNYKYNLNIMFSLIYQKEMVSRH